jgi:hypothetical protein
MPLYAILFYYELFPAVAGIEIFAVKFMCSFADAQSMQYLGLTLTMHTDRIKKHFCHFELLPNKIF